MALAQERKGGPYTKSDKEARREEVFRLHFDYGYSARKIAELMKISRNTINSDIDFWYSKITESKNFIDPESKILANLTRMEQQRIRIREYLDNYKSLQDKLAIERMLNDVNSRITNIYLKFGNSSQKKLDLIIDAMNSVTKEHKIDYKYMNFFKIMSVSSDTLEKIKKLMTEDKHRKKDKLT